MDKSGKSVAFRGGGFAPKSRRWVSVVVFIALILYTEWGTRAGWISSLSLPRPSDVLDTFRQLYDSGLLFKHLLPSLSRLFVGAIIGASIGIAVGITIGLFSYVRSGLVPLVAAIFPIPKIALLPLFVIWFGIGEGSKYALIAFGTFTPTVVATYGAVDNVDRTLIRMAKALAYRGGLLCAKLYCRAQCRVSCRVFGSALPSRSSCSSPLKCWAQNTASGPISSKPDRFMTLNGCLQVL